MIQQRFLELHSQKEVLAVGRTSQNGGLETGDGARKLCLIDQGYWHFQGDLCTRIEVTASGQQDTAR